MTIRELELEINKFYLDSEKDSEGNRRGGVYPNSVLMTKKQYREFLKELFNTDSDFPKDVFIKSICGLKVVFTSHIEKPKVIKISI